MDNISYFMGMGDKERARVKAGGRVDLTIADAKTLARSFLIGIVTFMPSGPGNPLMPIGALYVPATFVVPGALAEQFGHCACPSMSAGIRQGCFVFGKWLLGLICLMATFGLAHGSFFSSYPQH